MSGFVSSYFPFLKATVKSEYFAYKSRFLLWSFANGISFLAQLFLWRAIYCNSSVEIINGYSFQEIIIYLGTSKIVECLSFATVEEKVASAIRDGRIVTSLIKPISFRIELLFRSLGQIVGSVCLFLPIYVLIWGLFSNHYGISLQYVFFNLVLGFLFVILAFALNYYISLTFSCIIFKTVKHSGVYQLKKTIISFLSGSLFPISFYPQFMQNAIRYSPFAYLKYYPSIVIQGKTEMQDALIYLCVGVVWVVVIAYASNRLWNRAINHLIVFGG